MISPVEIFVQRAANDHGLSFAVFIVGSFFFQSFLEGFIDPAIDDFGFSNF